MLELNIAIYTTWVAYFNINVVLKFATRNGTAESNHIRVV